MEKHPSSSELLRRCLLERRDADWRLFNDRHGAMLRRILAGMLSRRIPHYAGSELDDALQDLYFRLLRYGGNFQGSSDRELWGFLCRTAGSVVVDIWRRLCRRGGWILAPAGLLRTTEAVLEVHRWARPPARPRRAAMQARCSPDWLARDPEEILLAREEALARYFALPLRRRRLLWRGELGEARLNPDQERR